MTYTQVKGCIQELGREGLEELIGKYGEDVILDALECDLAPDQIEEAYQGQFNSDGDFAMDLYDSIYGLSKLDKEFPGLHIDWEGTARDIMMDYTEANGHYFRVL